MVLIGILVYTYNCENRVDCSLCRGVKCLQWFQRKDKKRKIYDKV